MLKTQDVEKKSKLAFGKKNYVLMIAGIAAILLGFIIMTLDNETFGFGFMGLTLGPIILTLGFIIEFFAIMIKDSNR